MSGFYADTGAAPSLRTRLTAVWSDQGGGFAMTDAARIEKARQLLSEPTSTPSAWGLLAAASVMALSAVLMAGAIVLGPGFSV